MKRLIIVAAAVKNIDDSSKELEKSKNRLEHVHEAVMKKLEPGWSVAIYTATNHKKQEGVLFIKRLFKTKRLHTRALSTTEITCAAIDTIQHRHDVVVLVLLPEEVAKVVEFYTKTRLQFSFQDETKITYGRAIEMDCEKLAEIRKTAYTLY